MDMIEGQIDALMEIGEQVDKETIMKSAEKVCPEKGRVVENQQ